MPLTTVTIDDTFDLWRQKTNLAITKINLIEVDIGDVDDLSTNSKEVVGALNEINNQLKVVEGLAAGGGSIIDLIIGLS